MINTIKNNLAFIYKTKKDFDKSKSSDEIYEKVLDNIFALFKRIDRCAVVLSDKDSETISRVVYRSRKQVEDPENAFNREEIVQIESLPNDQMNPIFQSTVQAVEEAIINAMVAAKDMEGINGNKAYAIPHDLLIRTLRKYNRIQD